MKRALILLLLAAATCVQADVIVYKLVQTNTWTGGGLKFKTAPIYGRIVIDADTGEAGIISWYARSKEVAVDCPFVEFKYVRGPRNFSESAWFMGGDGYDTEGNHLSIMALYLRGANSNLSISADRGLSAPKLLRGAYRGSQQDVNGETYIGEGNVVATYMPGETQSANANAFFVHEVIEQWRQTWLERGYVEVWGEAPCE